MNKSYIFMLDTTGIFLSIFYFIILLGGLFYLASFLKVGFSKKSILVLFLYYYLIFILNTAFSFMPNFPDSELFGRIISEDYFPTYQSAGVRLFIWVTTPLRYVSLFKIEIYMLFQIAIFIVSLMIIWKSWQVVLAVHEKESDSSQNIFLGLAMLFPGFLLFLPVPLREFIALLGFSLMTYGLILYYYHKQGLWVIFLGGIFSVFVRPQSIVVVVLLLVLFQKNSWIKYLAIGLTMVGLPYIYEWIMGYSLVGPEVFAQIRNHGFEKYVASGFGYGHVEWHTYMDMLIDLPKLTLQFILAPLPILYERNPFEMLAFMLDLLFSIVVYFGALYAGFRLSKVYLFIVILGMSLYGLWEYHIGSAPRHRMPFIAILLPAASYGILKFYKKIQGRQYD